MTQATKNIKGPLFLCILDGVGYRESTQGNAVASAYMPFYDSLFDKYPYSRLLTHGSAVGLPADQMGNSEVGHLNIGAGRVMRQSLERIRVDLNSQNFETRPAVQELMETAKKTRAVHLIGMVSSGGVHSHQDHALEIAKMLDKQGIQTYIHVITDGRDMGPQAAKDDLTNFIDATESFRHVQVASVIGRFYAMDRDNRWERTQKAYRLMVNGESGYKAADIPQALADAYARSEGDEFIEPTALPALADGGRIEDGDALLFFNFRADRMRQLVRSFIDKDFDGFKRQHGVKPALVTTMSAYDATFNDRVSVIYPPEEYTGLLGEIISEAGLKQLRIAETEKYAHVTFFFNGGSEEPFDGEERKLIPSPKVRTYDMQPEMSLPLLTQELSNRLADFDVIICNIANGDMVGHTGDFEAAVKACEAIDVFLKTIIPQVLDLGGEALITADHGNVEEMENKDGGVQTAHSMNPVPFIYVGKRLATLDNGKLCDIAPTMLHMLGLNPSAQMDGQCLIHFS